jgi:hypothetical protein
VRTGDAAASLRGSYPRPGSIVFGSSPLKDGLFAPGRGSLAEVLPDSVKELFNRVPMTPADVTELTWTAASGRRIHGASADHRM